MKINFCDKWKDEEQYTHLKKVGNNPMFGYNWWKWLPTFERRNLDNQMVIILA